MQLWYAVFLCQGKSTSLSCIYRDVWQYYILVITWFDLLTVATVRLSTINLCVIILKPETGKSLLHWKMRYILGQRIDKSL